MKKEQNKEKEKKNSIIKGNIHSYESFGTVDGPGIRFVIFMQGCNLQCKYCHNRDTWDFIKKEEVTPKELLDKILRFKEYMDISNGGVTFSGGEPLIQSKFLIEILKLLKENNIHTTIDTSGMFPLNTDIKKVIELTDLFLVDIKHINDEKCKDLCGHSNKLSLEFIKYLNKINKPFWIRQVLIPGYTDDEKDLKKLKEFLNSLNPNNLQKVELLPYKSFGKFKWENLGLEYPFKHVKELSDEEINKAKKILSI